MIEKKEVVMEKDIDLVLEKGENATNDEEARLANLEADRVWKNNWESFKQKSSQRRSN